jgi:hypothetical protein
VVVLEVALAMAVLAVQAAVLTAMARLVRGQAAKEIMVVALMAVVLIVPAVAALVQRVSIAQ